MSKLFRISVLIYSLFVVAPNEIGSLFCRVILGVLSVLAIAIIMLRKRELVALLCFVAVYVLGLFLTITWVSL